MTTQVLCDYESAGPAGTTLTNGNTGGTVTIGVGCTAVSSSVAGFGALAGRYTCPATNVSSRTTSNITGGTKQGVLSFKFRIPTAFATTKRIVVLQGTGSVTACSFNYNGSTNQLQLQNAAGAGTVTVTNVLTVDTWYRVEFIHTIGAGTTDGVYSLNVYAGDSRAPVNAVPLTSAIYNLGTVAALAVQHGITANGTTVAADVILDSIRYDPDGTAEIGPESAVGAGQCLVGLAGTSTGRKVTVAAGAGAVGLVARASGGKVAVGRGTTAAGFVGRAVAAKVSAGGGRAALGITTAGAGRKVATATGRALVGFLSYRTIRRQRGTAQPGRRRTASIQSVERTRP
jgi:hypothetical protein